MAQFTDHAPYVGCTVHYQQLDRLKQPIRYAAIITYIDSEDPKYVDLFVMKRQEHFHVQGIPFGSEIGTWDWVEYPYAVAKDAD